MTFSYIHIIIVPRTYLTTHCLPFLPLLTVWSHFLPQLWPQLCTPQNLGFPLLMTFDLTPINCNVAFEGPCLMAQILLNLSLNLSV